MNMARQKARKRMRRNARNLSQCAVKIMRQGGTDEMVDAALVAAQQEAWRQRGKKA